MKILCEQNTPRDPTMLKHGRPSGFAESLGRSCAQDDRGGMFCGRSSFVGDGLARPVFRACRLRGGVRLFAGGAILAAARSHSRSDITL